MIEVSSEVCGAIHVGHHHHHRSVDSTQKCACPLSQWSLWPNDLLVAAVALEVAQQPLTRVTSAHSCSTGCG